MQHFFLGGTADSNTLQGWTAVEAINASVMDQFKLEQDKYCFQPPQYACKHWYTQNEISFSLIWVEDQHTSDATFWWIGTPLNCNSALCVSVLQVARDASGGVDRSCTHATRGFGARVSLFNAKKTYGTMWRWPLSLSARTGGGRIMAIQMGI